jgi:glucose/arabinose dehydrogenase
MQKSLLSLIIVLSLIYTSVEAQIQIPKIKLTEVFTGYTNPISMTNTADGRMFIVEQRGVIRVAYPDGTKEPDPFLDIKDRVFAGGEKGLLGLAFPPDFLQEGIFYVNYTSRTGGLHTVISSFRVTSDFKKAIKNSEEILLTIDQPYENHNGGCLEFGPDGYLYIGMGDGGSGGDPDNNAQNTQKLLGKMLRIDVHGNDYTVPTDNPFVGNPAYRPEIWSVGLRNPWRFAFDPHKGYLWIGDVGQSNWEEVDFETPLQGGRNYGWRCYEGSHEYNTSGCSGHENYTDPVFEYSHDNSNCSITGGKVFASDTSASLYGDYIFTDYCSGQFWATSYYGLDQFYTTEIYTAPFAGFTCFGYDGNYNMYVATEGGNIYRIDTVTICQPLTITSTDSLVGCGIVNVVLTTDSIPGNGYYEWTRNDEPVPGQNGNHLVINEDGSYDVTYVSDSCYALSNEPIQIRKNTVLENVSFSGLPKDYCIGGAALPLTGNPPGGTFSGNGIYNNSFYPNQAGIGNHFITYYYENTEGCSGFQSKYVQVHPMPVVHILTPSDTLCLHDHLISLKADQMDGMFVGAGVSGNTFNPENAGVGTHFVKFIYMPYTGCIALDSIAITVIDCSSSILKGQAINCQIYPSPVNNLLFIELDRTILIRSVTLWDVKGNKVDLTSKLKCTSKGNYQLSTSDLTSGNYYLQIITDKGFITKQIIKI